MVREMDGALIRQKIQRIRTMLVRGFITYDQAKTMAKPILDVMNAKGSAIAGKHGKRFRVRFENVI